MLKGEKASNIDDKPVSHMDSEMLKKLGGVILQQDFSKFKEFDPTQPDSYHIYATVDISNYSLRMKLIQTDLKTTKEMMILLNEKMTALIKNARESAINEANQIKSIFDKLEEKYHNALMENEHITNVFENETIPEIKANFEAIKQKYHERSKQKKTIIVQLQSQCEEYNQNLSEANQEIIQLKQTISELQEQNSNYKDLKTKLQKDLESLHDEINEKNKTIDELNQEIQNNKNEIQQLEEEKELLKKENERVNAELVLSEHHVEQSTKELDNLKEELPKERDNAFKALAEVASLKTENEYLKHELDAKTIIISTFSKQNNHLSTKLSTTSHSLAQYKESRENNEIMARINQSRLESTVKKAEEFKQMLSEADAQIEKYQKIIQRQKDAIANLKQQLADNEDKYVEQENQMKTERNNLVGYEVTIHQLQTKISVLREERDRLREEILSLKSSESLGTSSNENQSQIETTNNSLKFQNSNKGFGTEVSSSILFHPNKDMELTNIKLKAENAQLTNKISELQKSGNQNFNPGYLRQEIENLKTINKKQETIINTMRQFSPNMDQPTFHKSLLRLIKSKEFAESVLKIISETNYDVALIKITEMKGNTTTLIRIRRIFKDLNDTEIIETLKAMKPGIWSSTGSTIKNSNSLI